MKKKGIVSIAVLIPVLLTVLIAAVALLRIPNQPGSSPTDSGTNMPVGNVLDVDWYDPNGAEFTISTVEQLYQLAELSQFYDFAGQTVKLGADITVNTGNAERK